MQAVGRELLRRDIVAEAAGGRDLGEQVSKHVEELLLCLGDLLTAMH